MFFKNRTTLQLAIILTTIPVTLAQGQKVYWAELAPNATGRVSVANLDGSNKQEVANTGSNHPGAIALDLAGGKIYWTDFFSTGGDAGHIRRANLDGSDMQSIVDSGFSSGIALDPAGGKLFWTRPDGVYRANLDGSGAKPFIPPSGATYNAYGLAIDLTHGKLYWTESSTAPNGTGRIISANLSGFGAQTIYDQPGSQPAAIALHPVEGKMYWVDSGMRNLQRADLDGSNVEQLAGPVGAEFPTGVALDLINGKVYWSLADLVDSIGRIRRADLNGSSPQNYQPAVFDPKGIAIDTVPVIISTQPPACSIDARQPHNIDDESIVYGWNFIDLTFNSAVVGLVTTDFQVTEMGGDGVPPAVGMVTPLEASQVRVSLSQPIEPGAWTCIVHSMSGTRACLGYLPGDVNGDRTSGPVDVLRLIDHLNTVVHYEDWQTDVNRSGLAEPTDVLRAIDILNGAGDFEPWLNAMLDVCPL